MFACVLVRPGACNIRMRADRQVSSIITAYSRRLAIDSRTHYKPPCVHSLIVSPASCLGLAEMKAHTVAAAALVAVSMNAQPIPELQLFNVYELPGYTCNDGSPYKYYYRNCSANWDRKPGGPDFCIVNEVTWILSFVSGDDISSTSSLRSASMLSGAFCYDEQSCATRQQNLTSSHQLPSTSFPDGIVLPYAEANPNLYKSPAVVLPYCTSDLWAGSGASSIPGFSMNGSGIVAAVLRALFFDLPGIGLQSAQRVVITGGPGVIAQADSLAATIRTLKQQVTGNASATVDVLGLCDGCLLLDVAPPFGPAVCSSDLDCPAPVALPQLGALVPLVRPSWCTVAVAAEPWQCYSGSTLARALNGSIATTVLVFQQQFDAVQLASWGVRLSSEHKVEDPAGTWAQSVFAPATRSVLATFPYSVGPACSVPSYSALSSAWYYTALRHVDPYGHVHNDTMNTAAPIFLEDASVGGFGPSYFGVWSDSCGVIGCNPSACAL